MRGPAPRASTAAARLGAKAGAGAQACAQDHVDSGACACPGTDPRASADNYPPAYTGTAAIEGRAGIGLSPPGQLCRSAGVAG